ANDGSVQRIREQAAGTEREEDRERYAAGDLEGPFEVRLLEPQRDERAELEHDARAVEEDVELEEPLEVEEEAERVDDRARDHGDDRNAVLILLRERLREETVLRHRRGKAGEREEERVVHPDRAERSTRGD